MGDPCSVTVDNSTKLVANNRLIVNVNNVDLKPEFLNDINHVNRYKIEIWHQSLGNLSSLNPDSETPIFLLPRMTVNNNIDTTVGQFEKRDLQFIITKL
jgi:hypothetical protein